MCSKEGYHDLALQLAWHLPFHFQHRQVPSSSITMTASASSLAFQPCLPLPFPSLLSCPPLSCPVLSSPACVLVTGLVYLFYSVRSFIHLSSPRLSRLSVCLSVTLPSLYDLPRADVAAMQCCMHVQYQGGFTHVRKSASPALGWASSLAESPCS